MAFQSGSQVNAALGRTDFTPFLQGAMQGAQAQARGAELIGQGLAGLGQQVGRGIEKYSEQKKKNAERDGRINATLGALQANAKTLEKYGRTEEAETLRAASANILQETDLNKRAAMSQGVLEAFLQGQQIESGARQRQLGEQAAQYLSVATRAGDKPFSAVVKDGSGGYAPISPEAQAIGQQQYLNQQLIRSQIDKNLREKAAVQGVEMTQEEVNKIPAGTDFKGTPLANGNIFVTGLSRFAPGAQTNINMGENAYKKEAGSTLFQRDLSEYDAVSAAPDRIEKLDNVLGILKSGDITTGFGAELFLNANRIKAKFMNDQKAGKTVQNTELLDSLLSSDVFPMISALGVGARGMDTPAEREFLRQAFTGTKELDAKTLERLTEIRRDIELRTVKKYKDNYDKGTYKRFFEESGRQVPDFNSIPPKGVTSLQWSVMTPEQKALFQE
jgi:hypothetical protein